MSYTIRGVEPPVVEQKMSFCGKVVETEGNGKSSLTKGGEIPDCTTEGSKQRIVEKATHLQPPVDECAPWRTVVSAMLDDFPYNN